MSNIKKTWKEAISQLEKATNVKTSLNTEITKIIQNVLARDDFCIHDTAAHSARQFITATAQILREILQIDTAFSHIVWTTSKPAEIISLFSDPKSIPTLSNSGAFSSFSPFSRTETTKINLISTKSPNTQKSSKSLSIPLTAKKLKTSEIDIAADVFAPFVFENAEILLTRVLLSLLQRDLSQILVAMYPLFYVWLKSNQKSEKTVKKQQTNYKTHSHRLNYNKQNYNWLNYPTGDLAVKRLSEYMAHEIGFEFGKRHLKVKESVSLPEGEKGDPFGGFYETEGQKVGHTLFGQVACDGEFAYVYRDGEILKVCLGEGVGPRGVWAASEGNGKRILLARGWMFSFGKRLFYRQVDFECPEDLFFELDRDRFEVFFVFAVVFIFNGHCFEFFLLN